MPEPKQLEFLEKLEADKSDAHAVQLAKARQALNAAEAQLEQLKRYESGYHTQLSDKLENAVTIDSLRGHHRFMQNVAHAVRQQELEVARRRANADAIHRVWQEVERRRQAFRLMADKATQLARRNEDRRLQKSNDEFSSRKLLQSNIGRF
jgi:flagellar protein FliJ